MNDMIHSSEAWLRLLLVPSAKAAGLAVIALGLTLVLRKWMAPRWRHLLWMLVFARLVLPDVGSWKWSANRWSEKVTSTSQAMTERAAAATAPSDMTAVVMGTTPVMTTDAKVDQSSSDNRTEFVAQVASSRVAVASPSLTVWQWAGMVWLAGGVLMLAGMLACSVRFHRRVLGGAREAGPEWVREMQALRARHGWRTVPAVLMSARLDSPVLTGLWRPRIVLPATEAMEALMPAQRRHLLLHEVAHARRGDLWLQTASAIALAVHWFNPLMWLAHRRLRLEAEACADAWVLRRESEVEARDYGGTLLRMVTHSASLAVLLFAPGVLGMSGSGRELKERLTELALGRRRKRLWALGALAVIALAGAATFTRPIAAQEKPAAQEKTVIKGDVLEGVVVDEAGKPVAGAELNLYTPDSVGELGYAESDTDGRFRFEDQIKGQTVRLDCDHEDYSDLEGVLVTVGANEPVRLVLKPRRKIAGTVSNASDGKPVANARVYPGNKDGGGFSWTQGESVLTDEQGHYEITHSKGADGPWQIRVESEAHATFVSARSESKEGATTFDVKLQAKRTFEGKVLDEKGQPVGGALVWVAEGRFHSFKPITQSWINARLDQANGDAETIINRAMSDAEGRFQLKEMDAILAENAMVMAVTPEGIGRVTLANARQGMPVPFQKWSTLKVRFLFPNGTPYASKKVMASCLSLELREPGWDVGIQRTLNGTTDDQGWYTFEVVPDSETRVLSRDDHTEEKPLEIKAGETRELTVKLPPIKPKSAMIVQGTRRVSGTVVLPPGITLPLDSVRIEVNENADKSGRNHFAFCGKDGRFVMAAIAPGRYKLTATLPPAGGQRSITDVAAVGEVEFAFPAEEGQEAFDVGKVALQRNPRERGNELPLPKGPAGAGQLKVENPEGRPVSGAVAAQEKAVDKGVLEGVVVDEAGKPVAGAEVTLWVPDSTQDSDKAKSGADGRFQFEEQIKGQTVMLYCQHEKYAYGKGVQVTIGTSEPAKFVLKAGRKIGGTISSASDGKPVANARVYLGKKEYRGFAWTGAESVLTDAQGHYELTLGKLEKYPWQIRVESDEHATFVSNVSEFSEATNTLDAKLQAKRAFEGKVLDENGKAVAGALVWVAEGQFTSTNPINENWIKERMNRKNGDAETIINRTLSDAAGRFQLKEADELLARHAMVMAATPDGIGRITLADAKQGKPIPFQKWNTLKVRFSFPNGTPYANKRVMVSCNGVELRESNWEMGIARSVYGNTDDTGWYTFLQVLPDSQTTVRSRDDSSEEKPIDLKAGESRELTVKLPPIKPKTPAIVHGTRRVTGTVVLPTGITLPVSNVTIQVNEGVDTHRRSYGALCGKDGRFVMPNVAPGRYQLTATLPPPGGQKNIVDYVAVGAVEFAFAAEEGQEVFDVGNVALQGNSRERRKQLPLPKGSVATVKLKIEDPEGKPVSGAVVSGLMLYSDYALVIASDDLARIKPILSDEKGEVEVKFPRDLPGRIPIAAAHLWIEKEGYLKATPDALTDGESLTVRLDKPPLLEVRGAPVGAELWATFSNYGGEPVALRPNGAGMSGPTPYAMAMPFVVADQSDSKRWKFSEINRGVFQVDKTLVWEGKITPGVAIDGRVTGIATPVQGEAWAMAEVWLDAPVADGQIRPAQPSFGGSTSSMEMRWCAWCPVKEDGTFYFAGVPRGSLNLYVIGQGWVMDRWGQSGTNRFRGPVLSATDEVLQITRPGIPSVKKRIKVLAPDGSPAAGAELRVYRMNAYTNNGFTARGHSKDGTCHVARENRAAYERWLTGEVAGHRGKTGEDGIVEMSNQPAGETTFWVTWTDPKTGVMHRRESRVPIGEAKSDPFVREEPYVVDLSRGQTAR